MIYINRKDAYGLETVDEFDAYTTLEEVRECCSEYRLSDPYTHYYLSQKACKDWRQGRCNQ